MAWQILCSRTLEKWRAALEPGLERTIEAFFRSFASEMTKKTYLGATREFLGLAFQDISDVENFAATALNAQRNPINSAKRLVSMLLLGNQVAS